MNMTALDWVAPLGPAPSRDADHSHEPVADLSTGGIHLTVGVPYHIEVVDVPFVGASETELFGINNAGDIVGSYIVQRNRQFLTLLLNCFVTLRRSRSGFLWENKSCLAELTTNLRFGQAH